MALSDKLADLISQLQQVQDEAKAQEAQAPAEQPAPTQPVDDASAEALKALQDKVDALGKERDDIAADRDKYLGLINDHIADEEADAAKLKAAIAPLTPVPVEAAVPVVAEEMQSVAQPVNAGIQ